jgi:hypothetical protein
MTTAIVHLKQRRDLAANWTSADPILLEGEIGYEVDTGWHKIGDGTTAWASLGYYHGPPWIQGINGGNPSSTYPGAPAGEFYGIMAYAPVEPPITIAESNQFWNVIHGIGRHATDPNKLVILGHLTDINDPLDIGILDRTTGDITRTADAFNGTGMTRGHGIDCDPSTGIYVALDTNIYMANQKYRAFWSTDLTTWTQCANTAVPDGQAPLNIWYDTGLKTWIWSTSGTVFTSVDGKTFHQQNAWFRQLGSPFTAVQNFDYLHTNFPTSDRPAYPDAGFGASRVENVWQITQAAGSEVAPIPYQQYRDQDQIDLIDWPAAQQDMQGGVEGSDVGVFAMSYNGWIIYSATGLRGSWEVLAGESAAGHTSNELLDAVSGFWYVFTKVNEKFWATDNSGIDGWWYYDVTSTGGKPSGYGWVQDLTNSGPFGNSKVIHAPALGMKRYRDPDGCRFAFIGEKDGVTSKNYIWYDVGDL